MGGKSLVTNLLVDDLSKKGIRIVKNIAYKKPKTIMKFNESIIKKVCTLTLKNSKVLETSRDGGIRVKIIPIKNVFNHTMEKNLHRYLKIKMHHLIINKSFDKIIIIGKYDRESIISKNEKRNKLFNWHRPTARIKSRNLIIECPSGYDYVMHYGMLIANYLYINKRNYNNVYYIKPSKEDCEKLIEDSNLKRIKPKKIVIIGYGLDTLWGKKKWRGNGSFLYKHITLNNRNITLIGCKHSLWGDISERLVNFLGKNKNLDLIIYIGKLGTLNKEIIPNEFLATGDNSFVNGKVIKWKNVFHLSNCSILKKGKHYTSPSTLLETKKWYKNNINFDFVDPEIGYMALGAKSSNIKFSYIHIISNNLSNVFSENLSNERLKEIIKKRKFLLKKIKRIIKNSL